MSLFFVDLDSTPISVNIKLNNHSFVAKNKLSIHNCPISDKGLFSGRSIILFQNRKKNINSNITEAKKQVPVDYTAGHQSLNLPPLPMLQIALGINKYTFIANKGYDIKIFNNTIKRVYNYIVDHR